MPTGASKSRNPYTTNCVGNAKHVHEQGSLPLAIIGCAELSNRDMEPST